MVKRYVVTLRHGELNSVAHVVDGQFDETVACYSYLRDGPGFGKRARDHAERLNSNASATKASASEKFKEKQRARKNSSPPARGKKPKTARPPRVFIPTGDPSVGQRGPALRKLRVVEALNKVRRIGK
jgi:hypothetical protein